MFELVESASRVCHVINERKGRLRQQVMNNPYAAPQTVSDPNQWCVIYHSNVMDVADRVASYFAKEGYRLESGTATDGHYGIGNNFLRILFGAFVKRYKFHVQISAEGDKSRLSIDKGMSGAMGGAIGYSKMKKELTRIRAGVQTELGS